MQPHLLLPPALLHQLLEAPQLLLLLLLMLLLHPRPQVQGLLPLVLQVLQPHQQQLLAVLWLWVPPGILLQLLL